MNANSNNNDNGREFSPAEPLSTAKRDSMLSELRDYTSRISQSRQRRHDSFGLLCMVLLITGVGVVANQFSNQPNRKPIAEQIANTEQPVSKLAHWDGAKVPSLDANSKSVSPDSDRTDRSMAKTSFDDVLVQNSDFNVQQYVVENSDYDQFQFHWQTIPNELLQTMLRETGSNAFVALIDTTIFVWSADDTDGPNRGSPREDAAESF